MSARLAQIGLINPKTPANVGAVMRAAGCYGVDAVLRVTVIAERILVLSCMPSQL